MTTASAFRWLLLLAASVWLLVGSVSFLGNTTTRVMANVEPRPARDAAERIPPIEPIIAGTITAISPLPTQTYAAAKTSVAVASSGQVTPAVATAAGTDRWLVTGGGVNVRAEASSRSRKVGTVRGGETVTRLETSNKWVLVETAQGVRGWIYSRYLSPANEAVASLE